MNIRASIPKIDGYFIRFYDNFFAAFVLLFSLIVGIASSVLTNGKILNWERIFKIPTLEGLFASITSLCLLLFFFGIIYLFNSPLKLRSIGFRIGLLFPAAVHSVIWESIVFYLGVFGSLSILFKFLIPDQVLDKSYPQVLIALMHYFSVDMPLGINLSLLIAVLLTNLIFALMHSVKIVLDGGINVVRATDFFHGIFSLILSKILIENMLSYGFFSMMSLFGVFVLFQLLIAKLILVIKT
ncbi:MAG: hypothetical protein ACRCXZ_05735 [Patescibacteria group bacterium]